VDGYSSPRAKKLVLQVCKVELPIEMQGVRLDGNVVHLVNITMDDL
jgi:hypothetical protein